MKHLRRAIPRKGYCKNKLFDFYVISIIILYKHRRRLMNYKWTEDKIELLRKYYPNTEWEELFKILGTNKKSSIVSMAYYYKISRDLYNDCHCKESELEYIKEHCNDMSASAIGKHLGRDTGFVLRHMEEMGLHHMIKGLKPEDVELFKELYPKYTNKYLSEKFFSYLDVHQLRGQAKKFKLVKNEEKSIKWYDKEDLLDKLENAIKEHGRVPMVNELQNWGLPSDKTFTRYLGGLTKACELLGIERPNYLKPIVHKDGVYYDNNHNACLSLSEVMISNYLIEQGYTFEKEYMYKNVIPEKECGNKRFDWKIGDNFIEFFGLSGYKQYNLKTDTKIALCSKYGINLLPLYPKDLASNKWKNKIDEFLQ